MKVQDPVAFQIRKETLLQHARHLFATKGYAETTMDDIAQACKMQKASLYHYFESKEQMLRSMIELEANRFFALLVKDGPMPDFLTTLRAIATNFLNAMDDPSRREFFKILHFESHKNPWIFKAWKESPVQSRAGFLSMFEKHLEGRLSPVRIATFKTQFMGALIHYATLTRLRDEDLAADGLDDRTYIDQLVEIFGKVVPAAPAMGN